MGGENVEYYKKMIEELLDKLNEKEYSDKYDGRYREKYRDNYDPGYGSGYRKSSYGKSNPFSSIFDSFKYFDSKQFLVGALIGAAATYILSDAEIREKILRFGAKTFSNVAGGFEEFREQMADIKAEMSSKDKTPES